MARGLGYASLLALLVALVIVMTGQQSEIQSLVAPGKGGAHARSKAFAASPIGKAKTADALTSLQSLLTASIYDNVGSTIVDKTTLIPQLKEDVPEAKLGKPLTRGGSDLHVIKGNYLIVCSKPAYYVCAGMDLRTRSMVNATDSSEKQAVKDVSAKLGLGKKRQAQTDGHKKNNGGQSGYVSPVQQAENLQSQLDQSGK